MTTLPCVSIGDPPPSHSITFPGGMVLTSAPNFRPHDRLIEIQGMLAALGPAMAAMGPVFTIIEVVGAIIDMVKAVATLNPVAIADAAVAFAQAVDKLLGLVPALSLPLFIVGILRLVVDLMATMIDFLQAIQLQQQQIQSMREYAQEHSLDRMLSDADCLDQNVERQLAYFNNAMGAAAGFMVLVETLAGIAGLDVSVDMSTGGDMDETLDRLAAIVDTLSTVINSIPLP